MITEKNTEFQCGIYVNVNGKLCDVEEPYITSLTGKRIIDPNLGELIEIHYSEKYRITLWDWQVEHVLDGWDYLGESLWPK